MLQFFNPEILLTDAIALGLGALLAQSKGVIERIVNHEKYRIAEMVYQKIDPIISRALTGDGSFTYSELKQYVRLIATTGLSEDRVDAIARFIVKKFDLAKVFGGSNIG